MNNIATATRKRPTPLRMLATRYAREELSREEYLTERRRLLIQIERNLRAPATGPRPSPVPRPEETPGHGNRWAVLLIAGVILVTLAILLVR